MIVWAVPARHVIKVKTLNTKKHLAKTEIAKGVEENILIMCQVMESLTLPHCVAQVIGLQMSVAVLGGFPPSSSRGGSYLPCYQQVGRGHPRK